MYSLLISLTNTGLGIIGFFIGMRIILRLFSANAATPIVAWIYAVSDFLTSPFTGIFANVGVQTGVLDVVAVITLLGYVLLGFLLIELFRSLISTSLKSDTHSVAHYHEIEEDELGDLEERMPRAHSHEKRTYSR